MPRKPFEARVYEPVKSVKFVAGSRKYVLTGNKAQINQQVKEIVLNIKKAASIEKADNKNLQNKYTTEANLFAKYKERLQQVATGEQEARHFRWHTFSLEACQEALSNYLSLSKQPECRYRACGWILTIARELNARRKPITTNGNGRDSVA